MLLLLLANFHSVIEHISDQVSLGDDILFQRGYLGYIGRLRGLSVEEWHKDADLEHVQKLFVEGLARDLLIQKGVVVENLDLVLLD